MTTKTKRYMSGLPWSSNPLALQAFSQPSLAESPARHSAKPEGQILRPSEPNRETLGEPLSIRKTAELIGCSPWTVRQTHLPNGLPCFRSRPSGKLIFYRDQVVAWILREQQKGGR